MEQKKKGTYLPKSKKRHSGCLPILKSRDTCSCWSRRFLRQSLCQLFPGDSVSSFVALLRRCSVGLLLERMITAEVAAYYWVFLESFLHSGDAVFGLAFGFASLLLARRRLSEQRIFCGGKQQSCEVMGEPLSTS